MRKILILMVGLALFAGSAQAALSNPGLLAWNDEQRMSFGAGFGHQWFSSGGEEPTPTFGKEFVASASAVWALGRLSSLGVGGWYGFDNRMTIVRPQWTVSLGRLGQSTPIEVDAQIGYAMWFATGEQLAPAIPREFEAGVTVAWPLNDYVAVGGTSRYGLDSKLVNTFLGVVLSRGLGGQ